ncbi:MAG: tyrosine--tRNA ligase [Candidatus Wildermuthbacteria bacterium]|nr:tyrosine--tRNA ligase [Candidatus Wildermuthbacteria bacterium]
MKNENGIIEALSQDVAEILPNREGLEALMKKRPIRLYLGVDPTSPRLHLGHAIVLRKLRQFQDLGHTVVLLFGTFTAQIGDPSGKDKAREPLTLAQVRANMATYIAQAGMVLDMKKTEVRGNAEWLGKMKFQDVLRLASHITVSRLLERDMFQERLKRGGEVWAHEFLYPLMQGYDSVALNVDLEVGGVDQTFNMLVGRKLVQDYQQREKYVLTIPLLPGPDGRKMSKSLGNVINLSDAPRDMFGKLMAVKDELILPYLEWCARASSKELDDAARFLKGPTNNPKELKVILAKKVVALYHGAKKAADAEREFEKIFTKKELPSDIPRVKVRGNDSVPLAELLVMTGLATSKSDARRLLEQGGIKINGVVERDGKQRIVPRKGMVIQAGPRRFVEIA